MGNGELLRRGAVVKRYLINEMFYSIQGEGVRTGCPSVFVRFAGCNLKCSVVAGPKSIGGFDCDTDHMKGERLNADEIIHRITEIAEDCCWVVFTGGEPGLQLDADLLLRVGAAGYQTAIESNGTIPLPAGLDWITISPKVPEHRLRQTVANEVKYVRAYGEPIPRTTVKADHYLISPAANSGGIPQETLRWCINLVKLHPDWRISVQQHKGWRIR